MALVDNAWYINFGNGSSTGYYAVTAWAALTSFDCGALVRQLVAPAVGSERVFVAVVGHVASGAAEPTWTITRGGKTTDATITWQEATGIAALNGDKTNTPLWSNASIKNSAITLGQVIQSVNGNFILICTTAGTAGNGAEPTWAAYTTAGATTADNTVTWTTLKDSGNNFGNWAAPHARTVNAVAANWGQAGNSFYSGSNSAETTSAAQTITFPGTSASPNFFYCVDQTGSVPPVSADLRTIGTITTTGNSILQVTGSAYIYGIIFSSGSGANSVNLTLSKANPGFMKFEACALRMGGTSGGSIDCSRSNNKCWWRNCTVQFANTGSQISNAGTFVWEATASAITGATFPTTLFAGSGTRTTLRGVDISAIGSGTIFGTGNVNYFNELIDCKIGASATISTAPGTPACHVDMVRGDSGATNYRDERYWYQGTQTVETTIVRTGGATDGTTPISWKLVATANSRWVLPFESQLITVWNDSISAITTLTFYGTTTGGGVPNNDDIWIEVEYLGSGTTPQGTFITTTKTDNLAASVTTNNSSDASTWGGAGAGNGFKIVVPSFTPAMKGPLNITIKVAKASATYYIDPRPSISGITVSKSEILAPGVYANELSTAGMLEYSGMVGGMNG